MEVVGMTLVRDGPMATFVAVLMRMCLVLFTTHGGTPFAPMYTAK